MPKDYSNQFRPPNGNVIQEGPVFDRDAAENSRMNEEAKAFGYKAQRDSKGRFIKGNKTGKAGVSKNKKEVMDAMKDFINNPDTFASFQNRMLSSKNDVTFLEYYKFGYAIAYGKPGIRKEDRSVTVETMDQLIRPIIVPDSVIQEMMEDNDN